MSAFTMTYTEELTVTHCWCGIAVAIPNNLYRYAHEHSDFDVFCPIGHRFRWAESEADKLRKRLEREEARSALLTSRLDQEKASHSATKGQLTKTRKRVAGGACPCCKRTFVQLARHMATKHPNYPPPETSA